MPDQQNDILFEKFQVLSCVKKDSNTGIYIADHIYLGKKIFLKTLNQENLANPAILDRFRREARLLARLEHPNIIRVFDFGTYQNWFYISFEYFPSQDLRKVLRKGDLTPQDKENIFIGILRGLDAAHRLNIIHRDIKPENVLVDDIGQVKIADFGLALVKDEPHATQQESIVGTPGYMSPEQIRGESLTPSTDLFSLGILGYELITGKNPFLGQDAGKTLNNIISNSCTPELGPVADISDDFRHNVIRLLNKAAANRPGSAQEVLQAMDHEPVKAVPVAAPLSPKISNSYRLVIIILILVSVSSFIFLWQQKSNRSDSTNELAQNQTTPPTATNPDSVELNQDSLTTASNTLTIQPTDTPPQTLTNEKPEDIAATNTQSEISNLPGSIEIQCSPWAQVWIDSKYIDTTPLENDIAILPGKHTLALKHPEYPDYEQIIDIEPQIKRTIAIDLDTLCGYFQCKLYPWGDIYINDKFIGQTPLQDYARLAPGSHTLVVKNNNYQSVQEIIHIAKKETLIYQLNFEHLVTGN